ncbi:c-type cytochrome [Primorskyibacter sp. S187A]|uniref:cytochrome c n=1 Tax=Primorskyibacter sp. S187A TaxID=3415130 RepID=UPI003C7EBFFE
MPRLLAYLGLAGVAVAASAWVLTAPAPLADDALAGLSGNAEAGATIFAATGCASCHTREGAETLGGGASFVTDFGTFYAPNISPDAAHGIGGWTALDFANAVQRGVSPGGQHYYPAFPYTSYALMTAQDVSDLWAYMQTLAPDATPSKPHDVGFPFNIRRSLGGWKMLYADAGYHVGPSDDPVLARGRYLVEAMAHCAECHTPRDSLGGLDRAAWMSGAPNPSGRGEIPALTPDKLDWSAVDIAYYLETGFTPEFDSAGGSMAKVVSNTAKLSAEDRAAIAAYIKALPAP